MDVKANAYSVVNVDVDVDTGVTGSEKVLLMLMKTGSPPDFRSQAGDQCPEKVGMKLFWSLQATDAH